MPAANKPETRLTPKQAKELEAKVLSRVGDDGKRKLAKDGLQLIEPLAVSSLSRGLEFGELVDAGADGLVVAVDKFVSGKEDFSTYATWWIRQSILRTIADRTRVIQLPAGLRKTINKLVAARRRLIHSLDRTPTNKELAAETGVDVEDVGRIMETTDGLSDFSRLGLEDS